MLYQLQNIVHWHH